MREEFQAELATVRQLVVDMAETVRRAMSEATQALLRADRSLAEAVVAREPEVDQRYRQIEERACDLLALQAPVASDLRAVITALHASADLERMGDLAEHVATTALRRHPSPAVPAELRPIVERMAAVADSMAATITSLLARPDVARAEQFDRNDDTMDDLHRQLLGVILSDEWPYGTETAIDGALLGRYYERYADHAVNIAEHVVYLVTGETPN